MAIQDRNLPAGTKLSARYKGTVYAAEVVQEGEALRYRLADGQTFKSPSAAGSAVMGGNACNGWAFWSLDTGAEATTPACPERQPVPKPQPKAKRGPKVKGATPIDEAPPADASEGPAEEPATA